MLLIFFIANEITIGRADNNNIRINDPFVSNFHCKITREKRDVGFITTVYDNSTNGTYIDDKRIGKKNTKLLLNNSVLTIMRKKNIILSYTFREIHENDNLINGKYAILPKVLGTYIMLFYFLVELMGLLNF